MLRQYPQHRGRGKLLTDIEVNENEFCFCSGTYERKEMAGSGWTVHVDTGSMTTVCQVQLIWRKTLQFIQCVGLTKYLTVEHEYILNNA